LSLDTWVLHFFIFEEIFDVVFIFTGIAIILIARAANIYPITAIVNAARKNSGGRIINQRYQFFMWFAGLRGAIAFILAIDVPTPSGAVMRSTTIVIVYFTIFVMGGLTIPLLKMLNIPTGVTPESADTGPEEDYGMLTVKVQHGWSAFNAKYLKPVFSKKLSPIYETYDSVAMQTLPNNGVVRDVELDEGEGEDLDAQPPGTIRVQFSSLQENL